MSRPFNVKFAIEPTTLAFFLSLTPNAYRQDKQDSAPEDKEPLNPCTEELNENPDISDELPQAEEDSEEPQLEAEEATNEGPNFETEEIIESKKVWIDRYLIKYTFSPTSNHIRS